MFSKQLTLSCAFERFPGAHRKPVIMVLLVNIALLFVPRCSILEHLVFLTAPYAQYQLIQVTITSGFISLPLSVVYRLLR